MTKLALDLGEHRYHCALIAQIGSRSRSAAARRAPGVRFDGLHGIERLAALHVDRLGRIGHFCGSLEVVGLWEGRGMAEFAWSTSAT